MAMLVEEEGPFNQTLPSCTTILRRIHRIWIGARKIQVDFNYAICVGGGVRVNIR